MRCVLGVDAGATKAHAAIADEAGQVLGFGQGGPSNHQTVGLEPAMAEIARAARAAMDQAGLPAEAIETGVFCLAGADLPEDFAMLQPAVEALGLCRSVTIQNDTLAALRAGSSRPWAVVVICGTGFNAAGRAPDGRQIILPGLGPISGDWGGGADLALEIIRLVMRAWDGRGAKPPSPSGPWRPSLPPPRRPCCGACTTRRSSRGASSTSSRPCSRPPKTATWWLSP